MVGSRERWSAGRDLIDSIDIDVGGEDKLVFYVQCIL